jgi:alpha-pyrone synthase
MTAIAAIGVANPAYKRPQLETAELIIKGLHLNSVEKRLLKSIYRATGIEERYSVLSDYCKSAGQFEFFPNDPEVPFPSTSARMKMYKDNALQLALAAIKNCLSQIEGFNNKDITHVITVSCTGMYAPGIDIEIVKELNLEPTTRRTAINFMGCYGVFNAIKVADAICKAEPKAIVLIASVEICSIHFQKTMSIGNMLSNAIFADGSGAIIVQAEAKQKKYLTLEAFHCDLIPHTSEEMTWHISDNGFDIELSPYVPEVIKSGIAGFTDKLLKIFELTLADVDYYAIHPGGIKILEVCEEKLNISKEQNKFSYHVLRNYGNMSSATILFLLKAILDDINENDHQKTIFSCAFGPGLTLESMLLRACCV